MQHNQAELRAVDYYNSVPVSPRIKAYTTQMADYDEQFSAEQKQHLKSMQHL
jgi:hypothetical protein